MNINNAFLNNCLFNSFIILGLLLLFLIDFFYEDKKSMSQNKLFATYILFILICSDGIVFVVSLIIKLTRMFCV